MRGLDRMRNKTTVLIAAALLLAACGGSDKSKSAEERKAEPAPAVYRVRFETSKGDFVVDVRRAWAPFGADRFHELAENKFYDEARFFRVLKGFVVQWGIHKDAEVSAKWRTLQIVDDPPKESNRRGTVTFATSGPNSRTTQVSLISPTTRNWTSADSPRSDWWWREWMSSTGSMAGTARGSRTAPARPKG